MRKKIVIIIVLAILLIIQLFKIDTTPTETDINMDYLITTQAPEEIKNIMEKSCYDCHSNKTSYPWYSKTAPISWMINNHIKEGRQHINFSEWGNYAQERQKHTQKECIEEIVKNKMPLKSYTMIHTDSKLSDESKETIIQWFKLQLSGDTATSNDLFVD